jgi:hypothetical protein
VIILVMPVHSGTTGMTTTTLTDALLRRRSALQRASMAFTQGHLIMQREHPTDPNDLQWRISRACNAGTCVRVALEGSSETVFLGDSKHPDGPIQSYTRPEWASFVEQVKRGEYDAL